MSDSTATTPTMDQLAGQVCFEKLKKLKENVKWEIDRERETFFQEFGHLIRNWKGQLPNLRDIFLPEEIERLLVQALWWFVCHDDPGEIIIDFVARSGYKDKPDVGQDGKSRRTTPVHRAAASLELYRNIEIVIRKLFEIYDSFDVNYTDGDGLTHFHVACKAGCVDVVEKFLEHGHDPNLLVAKSTGDSLLHLALTHERTDVFESLLRGGANPNLANNKGRTALHLISQPTSARYEDCIRIPNIYRRDDSTARALFELSDEKFHPVQVDAQCKSGETPLHLAVFQINPGTDSSSLVAYLRRRGANPNLTCNTMGLTPLHYASMGRDSDCSCLAALFLDVDGEVDRTMQVDARNNDGWTPLHVAAFWASKVAIEILLRRGADANLPDDKGLTPLHVMCKENSDRKDLAQFFFEINDDIQQKVHVDARDKKGNSALHYVLTGKNIKLFELLLRRGANPNLTNAEGSTPLHRAVANLQPDMVEVLLDNGADLSNFVFPSKSHFEKRIEDYRPKKIELKLRVTAGALDVVENLELKLRVTAGALGVVENLEKGGFELDRSHAITIMNLFDRYKVFEKSADFAKRWCKFEEKAKDIMVKPHLSLCDLVRLRPKQATKLLAYSDYLKFLKNYRDKLPKKIIGTCAGHLCETMSRKFFKDWALDPFMELTRSRLPILPSEMIIEELPNEDLRNICLAATRLNS